MSGWRDDLHVLRQNVGIGHGPQLMFAAAERERRLRALLAMLPFPQLISFALGQLLGLVQKLGTDRTDAVWAHSTLLWLRACWELGPVRALDAPDRQLIQSFDPSLVVDAVRDLWRPMAEWRSHPEQARKDAEDAIFGRLMAEMSAVWSEANPALARLRREAASSEDPTAQRISGLLWDACIRSPLWLETEKRCWNELLDALEAELQRSTADGETQP